MFEFNNTFTLYPNDNSSYHTVHYLMGSGWLKATHEGSGVSRVEVMSQAALGSKGGGPIKSEIDGGF